MNETPIDDLFKLAIELGEADRAKFLKTLAPAVRADLEALLDFDKLADDQGYMEGTESVRKKSAPTIHEPPMEEFSVDLTQQSGAAGGNGADEDGFVTRATTSDGVPWRIGDYLILREAGRGGMGVVYEAQHEMLQRRVALKVLPPRVSASADSIDRFRREARSAGRLHHTNIVPIFEIACDKELHFYAMQFIDGQNLHSFITASRAYQQSDEATIGNQEAQSSLVTAITQHQVDDTAPESQEPAINLVGDSPASTVRITRQNYFVRVASIGEQICDALAYAHGQGVLHRDIKPANLILDADDTIWITDFGLAKSDGEDLTNTGDIVGTLRYMAPERFQGKSDSRSDLFSVGLTLYEMCALRAAYPQTDRLEIIDAIQTSSPPPARKLNPAIPRDLETIISKLVERDPNDRYQTGSEVLEDLRLFLSDRPIKARRSTVLEQAWRWTRRNPVLASLLTCVCVLTGLLVAGSISYGLRMDQQNRKLAERNRRALNAEAAAVAAKREQTDKSFQASLSQARAQRFSGRLGQHFETIEALSQATGLLRELELEDAELEDRRRSLRTEYIAALPLTDLRARPAVDRDQNWSGRDALAPDFYRRAETNKRGDVRVVEGRNVLCSIDGPRSVGWLAFGPKGDFLLAITPKGLFVWKAQSGEAVLHLKEVTWNSSPWAITKSGLLAVGSNGWVRVYSLESGDVLNERRFPSGPMAVAFANEDNGDLVVASRKKLTVWSRSTDSVQETEDVDSILTTLTIAAGSAVVGDEKGRILEWPLDDLDARPRELGTHSSRVNALYTSPNNVIASSAWDDTLRFWDLESAAEILRVDRANLIAEPGTTERRFHSPGFSADGSLIATSNSLSRTNKFEVTRSAAKWLLRNPKRERAKQSVWLVLWHPRLPILIVTTNQGIEVWDTRQRKLLSTVPSKVIKSAVFLDDGEGLLTAGASGLQRWPVTWEADQAASIELGEPNQFLPGNMDRMTVDLAQSRAVVDQGDSARLVALDASFESIKIGEHRGLDQVALCPDGKWLFTGTWRGSGIGVFDLTQQKFPVKPERILAANCGHANIAVSPDGKYLVASMKSLPQQVWKIGTWEEVAVLDRPALDGWPGVVQFSPDGRLLALAENRFTARILEAGTFAPLFALPPGDLRETVGSVAFNADATEIAVGFHNDVEIWDLEEVHQRLKDIDLHWRRTENVEAEDGRSTSR